MLLLETQNDTRTIKAGLIAIDRAFDELGYRLPIMVSGTIEQTGTMLAGQSADALATSLLARRPARRSASTARPAPSS